MFNVIHSLVQWITRCFSKGSTLSGQTAMDLEERYGAHNYQPLPVVLVRGKGVWLWDDHGKPYLDMMSAYSAISHGHCHPRLTKLLAQQAQQLAVTSRAFYSSRLGPFLQRARELTGMARALPMNSGAEAVETALKTARKWAYTKKGVAPGQAEIITAQGNFHGRTIAIIGFSTEDQYREHFGPFPNGFKTVPYGDAQALEQAITPNTAAFLVEPIQGEGGIIIPPAGYLKACETICRRHNVLLLVDEIQTGLGRTGKFLACEHENVKPDGIMLGKALGGGLLPVSLFLATDDVLSVFNPGDHGSTFGGNPLAATIGLEALNILVEEKLVERSATLGKYFFEKLQAIQTPYIKNIRGLGLFIGIEINTDKISAREVCLRLLKQGLLSKDTHATVIRIAPPLVISREEIDHAVAIIASVFNSLKN